jgi:hypothetical protein
MIKKLAVLVIEKADSIETRAGEKGDIYASARDLIRKTNDTGNPEKLVRVTALGPDGVLKKYGWKNGSAPVSAPTESVDDDEVKTIRTLLKDAGVRFSPNASIERLREQLAELGG